METIVTPPKPTRLQQLTYDNYVLKLKVNQLSQTVINLKTDLIQLNHYIDTSCTCLDTRPVPTNPQDKGTGPQDKGFYGPWCDYPYGYPFDYYNYYDYPYLPYHLLNDDYYYYRGMDTSCNTPKAMSGPGTSRNIQSEDRYWPNHHHHHRPDWYYHHRPDWYYDHHWRNIDTDNKALPNKPPIHHPPVQKEILLPKPPIHRESDNSVDVIQFLQAKNAKLQEIILNQQKELSQK